MGAATVVKERPILMSAPMAKAIRDDRKTVTRRVIKPIAGMSDFDDDGWPVYEDEYGDWHRQPCPYGEPGDRLWVKEPFYRSEEHANCYYAADNAGMGELAWSVFRHSNPQAFRSIFMPRWASRSTLEIVSVRPERLHEMKLSDIRREGFECPVHDFPGGFCTSPCRHLFDAFRDLWDKLNEKRGYGYTTNPPVWRIEFRRISS